MKEQGMRSVLEDCSTELKTPPLPGYPFLSGGRAKSKRRRVSPIAYSKMDRWQIECGSK